eukprot:CAMPEP_0201512658 /NCGR_PEP_ID=MMETSP0161_2-20130828/4863_1 /ASSEMBLY_ACC=CAM_ASM_000251 /TAXON_ID=180227 /ORGANISM="Neoparamoeba aestuarina, Strain SoJaBio B1-5/56/2" /LENGTH=457 /DNA_ID=CAMNT_0047908571 /DNA_START=63 /DNA_END=1436 /DNA_ORIENTATION=+
MDIEEEKRMDREEEKRIDIEEEKGIEKGKEEEEKKKVVVIFGIGSRGDLQPLVAVGLELKKRGWEVRVATEERNKSLIEDTFSLIFLKITGDSAGIIFEPEFQEMLAKGTLMPMMQETDKRKQAIWPEVSQDYIAASEGADLILSGALALTESYCVAEKRGVPWAPILFGPTYPTREFPLFFVTETSLFGWLNLQTYNFVFWALWLQEKDRINKWRAEALSLPPMPDGMIKVIQQKQLLNIGAFDPLMCPGEKVPQDYPSYFRVFGSAFVPDESDKQLEPKLEDFLQEGPPPLYLGFGSMPSANPQEFLDMATLVCKTLNCRAVIVAGWSGLGESTENNCNKNILVVKQAPHHLLLHRCQTIVHHCGAGTCAAALRSGRPQICVPVLLDQPHNANHMHNLGVAPPPIPRKELKLEVLIARLKSIGEKMEGRAKELGERVILDGTEKACDAILQLVEE